VSPIAELPAYERIADELQHQIETGTLQPGSQLPTVNNLAAANHVSTRTAFEALKLLQARGLTLSRSGTPAVVRERPLVVQLGRSWRPDAPKGSPWRAQMAAEGRTGSWEAHSEKSSAPPEVAAILRIKPSAPVMCTRYVFLADEYRIYVSTSWEPWDLVGGTDVCLPEAGPHAGKGVADRMALIGHAPVRIEHDVAPGTLTQVEAGQLELGPGIPSTRVQRTYWDDERPLETALIVVPVPHTVRFEIKLG
jgi:DNA-binding GntR family transcriptional regulator